MGARSKTFNTTVLSVIAQENSQSQIPTSSDKPGYQVMGHHSSGFHTLRDNLQSIGVVDGVNRQQNTVLVPNNSNVMHMVDCNGTYGVAGNVCQQMGGSQLNNVPVAHNVSVLSSTAVAGQSGGMPQMSTGVETSQKVQLQNATESTIPSLQQLRQASDIHTKVQRRYPELEDTAGHGNQGNLDLLL